MQGERGSLRDLQRYHRGADSSKRRLAANKYQIPEEDEVDGLSNVTKSSDSSAAYVPKIPKTNLATKSPKLPPRPNKPDKYLIKEEEYCQSKGKWK